MAQLNDLLVTGNSRFLNEINGKIDWLNINNKPTIIGTVTQVKVGSTTYDPTSGVISLPAYPSVPVTSVAGKTGAVTLTASDVGALASTTKYAGASTAGGSATSAAKLDTATAGSATQPCYFSSGVPSACTYSLNKTVPSDAVFTDTKVTSVDNHYTPTAASASKITITSTGGYPKKIEISRDAKGHVTAATVTETEVIPDNDFNVTQTEVTTDNNYEVTFSGTASTATKTEGVGKSAGFIYNPSRKAVTVGSRNSSTVIGNHSSVLGEGCEASGSDAHAEGYHTTASGSEAHAEGQGTLASGMMSAHAEGVNTTASGMVGAHAEGQTTLANGPYSHAEGYNTTASGGSSHAEGQKTLASGTPSHTEGYYTQATTAGAHAEGYASSAKPHIASGLGAHVEGYGTSVSGNTASGNGSHAEGIYTLASGSSSHAEGQYTTASGAYSHAQGRVTLASGAYSHAEGRATLASGTYSHAEGDTTTASGSGHAEGYRTVASGTCSHVEGREALASGAYSHVEGYGTTANHKSQHVFGEYNLADASTAASTDRGNYVEIVGNGTATTASNARTLDWDGNEWLAGGLESSYFVANRTYSTDPTRSDTTEIAGGYAHFINRYDSGTRVYQLNVSGIDIELNNGTWDGSNTSLKDAIADKLPLSGGTMTGAITTPTGRWYTGGNYALHLNNSDMIGVNGIWFGDVSSDAGEGLMFPRANGNWDDLYSVDGSLYYCVNRTTAGSRGSAYTILHTGNGVLSNGGKYTGGNKTAGYCLHGVGAGHTYACEWTSASKLAFWVDVSNVGTLSDRRLKDDIEPVNMGLVNAIVECESYQYKAFNRGGNISVGIMAQDLVENCKKYNVDPLDYELLCQEKFKEGDPTLYYQIDYDQLLYFKTIYLENKIKELEAKLDSLT